MSVYHYRLHDLTVRIDRAGNWPPWVFQKLDYFRCEPVERPNIRLTVGPFEHDRTAMRNVDHRYYAAPGELAFTGRWNGVRYDTHWSGLHTDHVTASLHIPATGLLRFPWAQQADWIAHLFVLKPITEMLWARRGRFVLHAAAAEKNGKAAVFCGFGSSLKTSFVMWLVRHGWSLIGDDQVLLTAEGLLPMPIGLRTFDFRCHHLPDEYLTRWRTLRLGLHLMRKVEPRVWVSDAASEISALNLLTRSDREHAGWEPLDASSAAQRVVAQCRAEAVQSVRQSPPIGEPLLAYAMMQRGYHADDVWAGMRDALGQQLAGASIRRVDLTKRWDDKLMEAVTLGGEGDA